MKKKKWLILVNSIIFLLLLGIMIFGIIIVSKNIEPLTDLTHLSDSICNLEPRKVSIEGVKIYTRPVDSTCGIATISTVITGIDLERNRVNNRIKHPIRTYSPV